MSQGPGEGVSGTEDVAVSKIQFLPSGAGRRGRQIETRCLEVGARRGETKEGFPEEEDSVFFTLQ